MAGGRATEGLIDYDARGTKLRTQGGMGHGSQQFRCLGLDLDEPEFARAFAALGVLAAHEGAERIAAMCAGGALAEEVRARVRPGREGVTPWRGPLVLGPTLARLPAGELARAWETLDGPTVRFCLAHDSWAQGQLTPRWAVALLRSAAVGDGLAFLELEARVRSRARDPGWCR